MKHALTRLTALALAFAQFSHAATFTVTHTGDSGPGSLRQALQDSQPTGADVIQFNIPGDGPHQIVPLSELPFLNGEVTLDGFTQPGSSPNTLATGLDAQWRIQIGEAGSTVPTLLVCIRGTNVIRGVDFVGGLVSVNISGANDTVIEGCQFRDNGVGVNVLRGRNTRIGGTAPAQRNVFVSKTGLQGTETTDFLIQGNFFGIRRTPAAPVEGNATGGLALTNSLRGTIGGTEPGAGNQFIGSQANAAIRIIDSSGQNLMIAILGNRIGTDFLGSTDAGNLAGGIHLEASGVTVGGIEPGAANIIAYNQGDGVRVVQGTLNPIRGNSIFGNVDPPGPKDPLMVSLGIDLGFDNNVTLNDARDSDSGANVGQNFPVLTLASNTAAGLVLHGRLNSIAAQTFTLDFYGNDQCDPSQHGEGQTYLGTFTVLMDPFRNVNFEEILNVAAPGNFITATATDAAGNTSEFCSCREVTLPVVPPQVAVVTTTDDSGPGSLRQAILDVNAAVAAASRRIEFNIPGTGVHTIAPLTELPVITRAVTLDGLSQPGSAASTSAFAFEPTLLIRLDGANLPAGSDGLRIEAQDCVVQGLVVLRVPGDGIELRGGGGHLLTQCLFGRDVAADGRPVPVEAALAAARPARVGAAKAGLQGQSDPTSSHVNIDDSSVKFDQVALRVAVSKLFFPDRGIQITGSDVTIVDATIDISDCYFDGDGEFIFAVNTPGITLVNSRIGTGGSATAVTLSDCAGARISDNNFVELRLAGEPVPPKKKPFISMSGGGNSSQGTPLPSRIFDNGFTCDSPFGWDSLIDLLDVPGQFPLRCTVQNNTFTLGSRVHGPIDRGGRRPVTQRAEQLRRSALP